MGTGRGCLGFLNSSQATFEWACLLKLRSKDWVRNLVSVSVHLGTVLTLHHFERKGDSHFGGFGQQFGSNWSSSFLKSLLDFAFWNRL